MIRLSADALADALRASRPTKPRGKTAAAARLAWSQWLNDVGAVAALACKDWQAFDRFSTRAGIVRLRPKKKRPTRD